MAATRSPRLATASRSPTHSRPRRHDGRPRDHSTAGRTGTTPPAEYYLDERHYLHDERFIIDNVWLLVDHESRIPKAGDYFVFEFGRGESVIILRDRGRGPSRASTTSAAIARRG